MKRHEKLLDGVRTHIGNTDILFSFDYSLTDPDMTDNRTTAVHDHSYYEMLIVTEGVLHMQTESDCFVKRNELLLVSPHVYHSTKQSTVKTMRYSVGFEIFPRDGAADNTYGYLSRVLGAFPYIKLKHCYDIVSRLGKIRDLLQSGAVCAQSRVKCCLNLLVFDLCDKIEAHREVAEQTEYAGDGEDYGLSAEDRTSIALDRIVSRCNSRNNREGFKTLDEVSQELYLGKKQINRLMKKRYNMTFKQKQIQVRVEYAKKLLAETDKTVEALAFELGYTNLTSFYKDFRRITGCTPMQYRASAQKVTDKKSQADV